MAKCKLSTDVTNEDAGNLIARPFLRVGFMGSLKAADAKYVEHLVDRVVCVVKPDSLEVLQDLNSVGGGTLVVVFEPDGVVRLFERFHTVIQDIARGRPVTGFILDHKAGMFEEVDLLGFSLRESGEGFVRMVEFAPRGGRSDFEMIDLFWVVE